MQINVANRMLCDVCGMALLSHSLPWVWSREAKCSVIWCSIAVGGQPRYARDLGFPDLSAVGKCRHAPWVQLGSK